MDTNTRDAQVLWFHKQCHHDTHHGRNLAGEKGKVAKPNIDHVLNATSQDLRRDEACIVGQKGSNQFHCRHRRIRSAWCHNMETLMLGSYMLTLPSDLKGLSSSQGFAGLQVQAQCSQDSSRPQRCMLWHC